MERQNWEAAMIRIAMRSLSARTLYFRCSE